jgi:hypothetical protein
MIERILNSSGEKRVAKTLRSTCEAVSSRYRTASGSDRMKALKLQLIGSKFGDSSRLESSIRSLPRAVL